MVRYIRDTHKVGLCCKECRDKELATLHQLFAEYTAGIEYGSCAVQTDTGSQIIR